MTAKTNPQAGDKIYVVTWGDSAEQRSEEVAARNAGEAVLLVHGRRHDPPGTRYVVAPTDATEPPRNFTVGHARAEAPFSD